MLDHFHFVWLKLKLSLLEWELGKKHAGTCPTAAATWSSEVLRNNPTHLQMWGLLICASPWSPLAPGKLLDKEVAP